MRENAMKVILAGSDIALIRRLEDGHAHSGVTFARASRDPGHTAEEICGGWAVYCGVGSPATQALAVGMNGPIQDSELDRLEEFFRTRQSPVIIDLCTMADSSVQQLISERGYVVREISHVLACLPDQSENSVPGGKIAAVGAGEMQEWSRLVMRGFGAPEEDGLLLETFAPGVHPYFCICDGVKAGGAAMEVHNKLATLFGDATLPEWRGRGLQLAAIRERVRVAAAMGCDLASASVMPGSISHRNYERAGFQMLYARIMVARS
jgi:GNAT superfamily N-acetyltransferase